MHSSKEKELLFLEETLKLLRVAVESKRTVVEELYREGTPLSSPQMLEANLPFNHACTIFCRVLKKYDGLYAELYGSDITEADEPF